MAEEKNKLPLRGGFENGSPNPVLQRTLEAGKTVIGIDIGLHSVNIVQMAMHDGRQTIIKTSVEPVVRSSERDRERIIREALKRSLSRFNFRKADVFCVLPSLPTVMDVLVMPVMPIEELASAVRLEVGNSQQFLMEDPVIDFQVIGRVSEKGVPKMKVLVAAAPRAAIEDLLRKFLPLQGSGMSSGKMNIKAVLPSPVCFDNIFKQSTQRMDETIAVIDMGRNVTDLCIYRNCQLEMVRKVPVAGLDLTRSLTSPLFTSVGKTELTVEQAEEVKREFGIPAPGENYLIQEKITAGQVLSLLRPKLEQLASEVSRSFDHYQEKMGGGKVDRILLYGGGAQLKGLAEFLNAEIGLPVEIGDPLQEMNLLFEGVVPEGGAIRLSRAIGASLADGSGINLFPKSIKEGKDQSLKRTTMIVGCFLFLGALAACYFGLTAQVNTMKNREEIAKQEYEALFPKLADLKEGLLFRQIIRQRPDMGGFIKQLTYLPEGVYLTEFSFLNGKVYLSGFVTEADKKAKDAPVQLMRALKKGFIPDAEIFWDRKTVPGKTTPLFEIEGTMKQGGGR